MDGETNPVGVVAPGVRAGPESAWRAFGTLWAMQALIAGVLFYELLSGHAYFAYIDIGADTYETFSGYTVLLARLLGREGFSGWSFGLGWGAPTAILFADAFRFLGMAAGPEHVLDLRIWVYVLKIALGGSFFLLLARTATKHREAALTAALLYSFCGYMVVNGEWDSETQAFVFFPLVLWAIDRFLRKRDFVSLPLAIGAALLSGLFFLNLGVSLGVAFLAWVAASEDPKSTAMRWVTGVVPLVALGYVLAAPLLLPLTLQMLDSPRLAGEASLLQRVLGEAFNVSSWRLFLEQIGAVFHKDLFGIGDLHRSYMNYLESPEFYVGLLPLLAASQLWRGSLAERRLLVVGLAGVLIYFAFPVFRLAAFGFASPYFRATCLWPTLGLLWLGLRGLDRMIEHGVDRRSLAVGAAVVAGMLGLVVFSSHYVWDSHALKIVVLGGVWLAVLAAFGSVRHRSRLVTAMLLLALVEIIAIAWPSYFALRSFAGPTLQPAIDVTQPALAAIRKADTSPFYRVEKMYQSKSEADATMQDYYGVRSYYYHGRAVIDFHTSMDLMRRWGAFVPINKTNWTAAPQDRYFLHSLLGVRYLVSKKPLDWPGFESLASGDGWFAYRNELALPLGFVQSAQVTRQDMAQLNKLATEQQWWFKDAALINAVVLDEPMPQYGTRLDITALAARGVMDVPAMYAKPALELQRTGLVIESFRNDRITGNIQPTQAGILVFTIPAYRGWSLRVDGQETPLITANFGMLAAPVAAGKHRIELEYNVPGLRAGLMLFVLGAFVLVLVARRQRPAA